MHVSLRQLRVFQAIARSGNFTKAGETLALTQPAVSRAVLELEQRLGIRLLDRTAREVTLTAAGHIMASRLDRVLDDLDTLLLDVQGLASQQKGRVRVASSPTLSANLLPECIARCQAEHPGLELVVYDRLQEYVLGSVMSGEVDFGLINEPRPIAELQLEPILTEPFELVCAPTHRFARLDRLSWQDLDNEPLILLDRGAGSRRLIDDVLSKYGVQAKLAQEVGHATTIFRMVMAGLGLSVVPHLAIPRPLPTGLTVRPIFPRVERRVVLARRARRALSPQAEVVWALIREVAADYERLLDEPKVSRP